MKTLAAIVLATSLAAGGCAHSQTPRSTTARNVALTTAVIGAIVLTTILVPCAQCNDTFISPSSDGARR
jgi:hypothetical protein